MSNLRNELALAWQEKAERLAEEFGHMETGFALFRPECVQQTRSDLERAVGWMQFWARQS